MVTKTCGLKETFRFHAYQDLTKGASEVQYVAHTLYIFQLSREGECVN